METAIIRHRRAWVLCSAAQMGRTCIVRPCLNSLCCLQWLVAHTCRHILRQPFFLFVTHYPTHFTFTETDYGGYFSDNPNVAPDANRLYRYSISSKSWSAANAGGDTVTRVAEGASAVSPPQGSQTEPTFYYFGGHIDTYTTEDWSNQTPRVYLSSMIEYNQATNSWTNHSSVCHLRSIAPCSSKLPPELYCHT